MGNITTQIKKVLLSLIELGISLDVSKDKLIVEGNLKALDDKTKIFLKSNKSEVMDYIRSRKRKAAQMITQRTQDNDLPLSFAQQRLWFIDQLEPGGTQYNMPMAMRLNGRLNEEALQKSFDEIIRRHEILRTTYYNNTDGDGVQRIQKQQSIIINKIDISQYKDEEQLTKIFELADKDAQTAFDLTQDLMLRVSLITLSDEASVLLFNMHHIASDAWSMGVLTNEFVHLYTAFCENKENPLDDLIIQYADFSQWQRNWLSGDTLDELMDYWKKQLADMPNVSSFPLDKKRPAKQSFKGNSYSHLISQPIVQKLQKLSASNDATLFMTMQAIFSILMSRYSGQSDIVLGTSIANRPQSELAPLIGFFVNALLLRCDLSKDISFLDYLVQTKNMTLDAYDHQSVPFEMLVEALQSERNLSHSPLFQVMISMQNNESFELKLPELSLSSLDNERNFCKFDLTLILLESDDGLNITWEYCSDLFELESIQQFAASFEVLVHAVANNPNQPIYTLPLIEEQQEAALLKKQERLLYPQDKCFHEIFEAQVAQTPERVAIQFKGSELTYQQLNSRANQIAHYLREQGINTESLVGLYVERSPEMVIGIIAILKAGGAYVPLDTDHPASRLEYILDDTNISVVLCQAALSKRLAEYALTTVPIDQTDLFKKQPDVNLDKKSINLSNKNLAYIIYTSGSTGQPKGVMVEHQSLVNLKSSLENKLFNVTQAKNWGWNAPFSFDSSIKALTALSAGVCVTLIPTDVRAMPSDFIEYLLSHQVDIFDCTPSHAKHFLADERFVAAISTPLHWVIGGEAISEKLWQKISLLNQQTSSRAFNVYGPTECTVNSSLIEILPDNQPNIGKAIDNVSLYVVDQKLQLKPVGAVGELVIGGDCLARGYLNSTELSEEKFVRNPFEDNPEKRVYKTGDLVRWLHDGHLEYIGRVDEQVKIRGYRIELGEIEHQLMNLPEVKQAVVLAKKTETDDYQLLAYMTLNDSAAEKISEAFILEQLSKKLPEYMLPARCVTLENLPLTVNGKVDRKKLKALNEQEESIREIVLPSTEIENKLKLLWLELLKLDDVSVTDNFFAVGGHSLLTARLISQIKQTLKVDVSVRDVFEHNTIHQLASYIEGLEQSEQITIPVISREQSLPLSFSQQRLWFIDQLEPGSSQYNMPMALRLKGELNQSALQQSLDAIIARHEVLRTTYQTGEDGEGCQVIHAAQALTIKQLDLSHLADSEREAEVMRLAVEDSQRGFDLSADLMLRVSLLVLSDTESVLLFNLHHIASDGWSMGVLTQEFVGLYQAYSEGREARLPPLAIQYADFAHWQREWLSGERLESELSYWEGQLSGIPAVHSLPLDKPRPVVQSVAGASLSQSLSLSLSEELQTLSQSNDATLFMTLQTAFAVLLSRYSHESDIVMGTPIANRTHSSLSPLIGFFVNTLVLRNQIEGELSFNELLQQSKQMSLSAFEHQHLPFEMLVERLQPTRSFSHTPLFQVMFVLQNNESSELSLPKLTLSAVENPHQVAKYDLTLSVKESPDGLLLNWEYCTDLFEADTIKRLTQSFEVLLQGLVAESDKPINQQSLLTEKEKQTLLLEQEQQVSAYPDDVCMHELFEKQVELTPDAIVAVYEEQSLTYRELNKKANRLAHYLVEQGVKPDDLVGLYVERSLEMLVGLLGILKAGGAYVPLDPAYPKGRLSYMLDNAGVSLLLTQSHLTSSLDLTELTAFCLDDELALQDYAVENIPTAESGVSGSHLAYVIYTSGSTGQPKGVMVEHQSIINSTLDRKRYYQSELNHLLMMSSVGFDIAAGVIFWALTSGAALNIMRDPQHLTANEFVDFIIKNKINCFMCIPSFYRGVMDEIYHQRSQHQLNTIILGGESLTSEVGQKYQDCHYDLFNEYGPTEATVWSSVFKVEKGLARASAPIGRTPGAAELYVLNDAYSPQPVGAVGELFIGGKSLARGYWRSGDLTEKSFIRNASFAKQKVLYKTGDLVRRLADGNLEFVGRVDHQIKLRGYRIELGEIEFALLSHEKVNDATVVVNEQTSSLIGYIASNVDDENKNNLINTIKAKLVDYLPEYMVPDHIIVMASFPLTTNGKIDREALPQPENINELEFVAANTKTEITLSYVWGELLSIEKVSVTATFFELGGHSLLVTRLISQIKQTLKVDVSVRDVFEHNTIRQLASYIEGLEQSEQITIPVISREQSLPLSFSQQRLWFIDQLEPGSSQYNMPMALRLKGELNQSALQQSLDAIIARHEVLRTTYQTGEDGEGCQVIHAAQALTINQLDLSHLADSEREAEVMRLAVEDSQRGFDLSADLMLRVSLLVLSDTESVLLFNLHHIASDGWSMGVLTQEFVGLYQAYSEGREARLPALAIQYADFAHWQREWLSGERLESELSYWEGQLSGIPAVHSLPLDKPRPVVQSVAGASLSQSLSLSLSEELQTLSQSNDATLFMTLQTAFAVLLSRYSHESDIVMGTPIANRTHSSLSPLIGFFVNTLVLRNQIEGELSFSELLQQSKQMSLSAFEHQQLPFEMLVERLQPTRSFSHTPLFQVMFTLQNEEKNEFALPRLSLQAIQNENVVAKYDLMLSVTETKQGLVLSWNYCSDLFNRETIQTMASSFELFLSQIVQQENTPVSSLNIVSESDQQKQLDWLKIDASYPTDKTIVELFKESVEQQPNKVALVHDECEMTYHQLDEQSDLLALYLLERHAKEGDLIGICVERSPSLVIAMLAVAKVGAAYVPLDPDYPESRLQMMLDDGQLSIVITEKMTLKNTPSIQTLALLMDDDVTMEKFKGQRLDNLALKQTPQSLAYVMYTSGSTGRPKGVMVHQLGIIRLVVNSKYVEIKNTDVLAQASNCSFDAATFEIWGTLLNGAQLAFINKATFLEPKLFSAWLKDNKVNTVFITTAIFNQMAQSFPTGFASLDNLLFGGEKLNLAAVNKIITQGKPKRLLQMYGPTENTTFSTSYEITEISDIGFSIGKAIEGSCSLVLDSEQRLLPVGAVGELVLGGDGVAQGYMNQPELSDEKFINLNQYSKHKFYRSGDLVRYEPDGNITFVGRVDDQVKIRGFRIEPGEVAATLLKNEKVKEAYALVSGEENNKRLIAYIEISASEQNEVELISEIKSWLKSLLPEYMVPSAIVIVDSLPINANGKIDKNKLPAVDFSSQQVFIEADSDLEVKIREIWAVLLDLEKVSVTATFFELGGHSLLVTRLISQIKQTLKVDVSVRDVFEHNTIRQLASYIEGLEQSEQITIPVISREQPLPLSFSQQRLWFIDQLEPGSSQYNMPMALRLKGELNQSALQQSLDAIIARHEVLRTTYQTGEDGEGCQVIHAAQALTINQLDLSHLADSEREAEVMRLAVEDSQRGFDLSADLMLRVSLLVLSDTESVLLFNLHHIASDGWSMGVLTQEFVGLYQAYSEGREARLPALAIQYADFAHWQREWLSGERLESELSYWEGQLSGIPAVHSLPLDKPRPVVQSVAGASLSQSLSLSLSEELQTLSQSNDATLFMTLQTAFAVLLSRYSHESDIVMGTPIANRTHSSLSPLIGFFVNTLVLRNQIEGELSFNELLQQSKQMSLSAFEHQHLPFEMLVERLQPTRSFSHTPLFQVMFALQNNEQTELTLPNLKLEAVQAESSIAKFDLTVTVEETSYGLNINWNYSTALFEEQTIENLSSYFARILALLTQSPEQPVFELITIDENEYDALKNWNNIEKSNGNKSHYPEKLKAVECEALDFWIMDSEQYLLPKGAIGELVLVAQPENKELEKQSVLTKSELITQDHQWLLRTGELARINHNAELSFLGRMDEQVKIEGLSFNLSSVKNTILAHDSIEGAYLSLEEHNDTSKIVAYVIPKETVVDEVKFVDALHSWLNARLQKAMLPKGICLLAETTVSFDSVQQQGAVIHWLKSIEFLEPVTSNEIKLASAWKNLLGLEQISLNDNFFALGGSSLTLLRLEFSIQEYFNVELSIRELFENPLLSQQVELIQSKEKRLHLSVIEPINRKNTFLALSYAQRRLWFIDQMQGSSAQYNMPIALRLKGTLNRKAMSQALNQIIQRHEILRTQYQIDEKGEGYQVVLEKAELAIVDIDFSHCSNEEAQKRVNELALEDMQLSFKLDQELMIRCTLIKIMDHEHVLLLNIHHIAFDGWSVGILTQEFSALYSAFINARTHQLPALDIQYADYADWQKKWLQGDVFEQQMEYWQMQLKDLPLVHNLILDKPRPKQQTFAGSVFQTKINAGIIRQLDGIAQENGATLFMLLQSVFALLIARYSREQDVVVGTPVSGRSHKQVAPLIGFFVNSLVLRNNLSGNPTFIEYLNSSKQMVLDAFDHQDVPFEMLVDQLNLERNLNHAPLFQLLFSLQNNDIPELSLPGLTLSGIETDNQFAKFELSLHIGKRADGDYSSSWEYNIQLFNQETVAEFAQHYNLLLEQIVANPNQNIYQIPLINQQEQVQFSTPPVVINSTVTNQTATNQIAKNIGNCIHHIFEQQAFSQAQNVAVSYEQDSLTYQELNQRANRLARYLIEQGVTQGAYVGLLVERSFDIVVGILATLKVGAAYVPLEPGNPDSRIEYMIDDAKINWVITQQHLESRLSNKNVALVSLDCEKTIKALELLDSSNIERVHVLPENAAYVIYTSGSTGKPKGVIVEHKNVIRLFETCAENFTFNHNDCWTLFHSYAFDFSVWEIWGALLHGGKLVVVPYEVSRSVNRFYQLLIEHQVTVLNQTPSAFYLLSDEAVATSQCCDSLRYIVFGGEALELKKLAPWFKMHRNKGPKLINMYGITETTVHVTYREILEADIKTSASIIGQPLSDLTGYVCNEFMTLQPVGAVGELYIGGAGVARGYLNRPELNKERFIKNIFSENSEERLYRTGDLVRWNINGELEYLGRADQQAKLRGFRIELGEIEQQLIASQLVKESVVLIQQDASGHQQLNAYVVATEKATEELPSLLRKHLSLHLPAYMVPSSYTAIERIPLTINGKVDAKLLLSLSHSQTAANAYVAPENDIEEQLCHIWQEVLNLKQVGINDNFFAIGGDSIRVVQIVKRCEAEGLFLEVKDIFTSQTIREISDLLINRVGQKQVKVKPANLALINEFFDSSIYMTKDVEDCYPVTQMQQQMLEMHKAEGTEPGVYQPTVLYDVKGVECSFDVMQDIIRYIINKTPVFRTQFSRQSDGQYIQKVMKTVDFHLGLLDLRKLNSKRQQKQVAQFVEDDLNHPFDESDIQVRFSIIQYADKHWGLYVSTHHAVIDGWALVEIRNQILALYPQVLAGTKLPEVKPVNVFKEHVALELEAGQCDEQLSVWQSLLAGYQPMPELTPLKRVNLKKTNQARFKLESTKAKLINELARKSKVPLKALLLLAYQRTLGEFLSTNAVTIDIVTSGRSNRLSDPLNTVGLYWNLLPLFADLYTDDDLAITDVTKKLLVMDSHSLFPVSKIKPLMKGNKTSYAAFNFVNFHNEVVESRDVDKAVDIDISYASDRFHYALKMAITGGSNKSEITGTIDFDRLYFTEKDAHRLIKIFGEQLNLLIKPRQPTTDLDNKSRMS
ncbi:amino acid adenylation domain-containing protein [Aliikangiella sp. IMCC44359]|uniref:amino acid adenylation domain-containing protein n=1 Tax=Aliikangiella sp. IMCC44359 TaxID=3459125 RepID=UPI00403A9B2F